MEVSRDRIRALMDQVREIHENPRNQARSHYWQILPNERWEPAFIRTLPAPRYGGSIPFVVEPGLTMWAEVLGFDMRAYYEDPLAYLTAQLEMKVYHAQHFKDDTYIDKSLRLLFATLLEGSVLGVPYGFTKQGHPWLDYLNPPIQDREDLKKLKLPDFYRTGIMPTVHRFYAEMTEVLDDDFLVKFPDWIMGPFGVACELRGFDQFLVDLLLDLEFAQQLLRFVVEARLLWQTECDRFLGVERTRGLLGNDDVNCPTLSPDLYRDVILPLETELSEHYGGIFYWHSCGNTTELLDDIARIPGLDLFHCGPWTDVTEACRVMGDRGVPLEICVDPVDKVQMASPADQKHYLEDIVAHIPDTVDCYIKADSLEVIRDLPTELAAIQSWIDAAREVLG
jgi:uroporphyrinogen-III decarboxylase